MNASSFDSNPALVNEARQRVRMKTGLRIHAAAFVLVSAGMLAINLLTSPAVMWFWFPWMRAPTMQEARFEMGASAQRLQIVLVR